ncbi:hypothetical protein [Halococcus sediminicola]|uniref:hypothetical protein n=1 Tax=Halococcus sediminicola TaxID=1264579 RepID=UPI000678DD6D|nr:hypothetical protein [Halococcus sediminicola]
MQGEYTSYADKFSFLDRDEITGLGTGQAIFASRDFPKTYVDVREPLTLAVKPDPKQIEELDAKYSTELPDLNRISDRQNSEHSETTAETEDDAGDDETGSETDLNEEEETLLEFISNYIREQDQTPTYSKCHREGPFGTQKTRKILGTLEHNGKIEKEAVVRGGQDTEAYKVI